MKLVSRIVVFLVFLCCKHAAAVYYDISTADPTADVGEPLYLTPYINKGYIELGQEKARVRHHALTELESYAGFITINKEYNSNSFFWFFPSQSNPKEDPVILWFIGGPGITVLIATFEYNGPLTFTSKNILETRNYSLPVNHSVIYIDNPIGAGFSFTDDTRGYAKTQDDIDQHILIFLTQFFKLFPEYRKNNFFVGGDSYGGKFVIAIGHAIKVHNDNNPKSSINLKGLMIGNGLVDNNKQGIRSEFLYQTGLIDEKTKGFVAFQDFIGTSYILLNGLTGFVYYQNLLYDHLDFVEHYKDWVVTPDFRRAVHVGDKPMNFSSTDVTRYLQNTFFDPRTHQLEELLNLKYKVLLYNGQLDFVYPYTSSQSFYETFNWTGAAEYRRADRQQWWYDGQLTGYVKNVDNMYDVLVRYAGHVTFFERPKWTCELYTRFTHDRPIIQEEPQYSGDLPSWYEYL